ncbi:hypothetical protein DYU11_18345 [Fibrisoma montanum]|uniref:Uncharacterized protein n=1 Tax=Fibrisoma montanum TaxID=2305895 RepID=A0A418M617_9BACT|nr:hypothetical protein [Fibrisoma montanum]RIV21367.1 hypothetical protein DYU11_18345 [Fibrisoma montanum]
MILGSDLNFDGNQALNLVLEKAVTAALDAGLTVIGEMGYDTTLQRAKIFDGTTIRKLLQDNDISTDSTLGGASASDVILASQKAVKQYVDSVVSSGQNPISDFDAANATNLPSGATLKDRYRASSAGTVQGLVLQVGDMLLPKVSGASSTDATQWVVIQGNADAASTSVLGLVILATLAQIQGNAGGDANKVITVAQLNAWEAALGRVKSYTTTLNIAAGANGISHNLNSSALVVSTYEANGPVLYKWTITNANTISINAAKARNNVTVVVVAK